MTFQEILKHLDDGKKVRRRCWDKKEYINFNWCDRLAFSNSERCPLTKEDYMADDWEVYDDREYFDFHKAFELMEEGKKVRRAAWENFSVWLDVDTGRFFYNVDKSCVGFYYNIRSYDFKAKDWYLVED